MPHFFGQIQKEFWPIISLSLSGPMQWNIWYGHTNLLFQQMFGRASLPWNIYPGSALTIWISSTEMCGNVQSLSLKYTLTSNFPSGITSSIGSFCWTFWQTLLWWWLTSVICLSTSSHLNSMLFFNDLQLCLYRWWYESVVEVIVFQHEHKLNAEDTLDKAGTIIYQPPPSSRCFAQMKLDYNKVANINFAYVVKMKISCMIAILLSQESHPYISWYWHG